MPTRHALLTLLLLALPTMSCSQHDLFDSKAIEQPKITQVTQSTRRLASLPPSKMPLVVAVYDFQDQTGQLKPNNTFAEYSHAVTQGGLALLNKALLNAGNGTWFTVAERGGLKDLLQERQIITAMREQYKAPNQPNVERLPPLLFSGMLIEGGIVGYDSNVVTGGAGANYLGIGGNVTHQRDIVTVDLRAVSIANGQVVLSVSSEKTIYSTGITGNVFKYVSLDHLLEAESGFTMNEPPHLAVRQAIETAVYELIMEGARKGIWQFADPQAGNLALNDYMQHWEGANMVAQPALISAALTTNPQLPPSSVPAAQPINASDPKAEKQAIIGKTSDFLSSGDANAPAAAPNSQFPPIPAPIRH